MNEQKKPQSEQPNPWANPVGKTNAQIPPPATGLASGLTETARRLYQLHLQQIRKQSGQK